MNAICQKSEEHERCSLASKGALSTANSTKPKNNSHLCACHCAQLSYTTFFNTLASRYSPELKMLCNEQEGKHRIPVEATDTRSIICSLRISFIPRISYTARILFVV